MKHLLFALCFLAFQPIQADLTNSKIRKFLDRMENIIEDKSIDSLMELMHKDCYYYFDVEGLDPPLVNIDEFRSIVAETIRVTETIELHHEIHKIQISSDLSFAIVNMIAREDYLYKNKQRHIMRYDEVMHIKEEGDTILVKYMSTKPITY